MSNLSKKISANINVTGWLANLKKSDANKIVKQTNGIAGKQLVKDIRTFTPVKTGKLRNSMRIRNLSSKRVVVGTSLFYAEPVLITARDPSKRNYDIKALKKFIEDDSWMEAFFEVLRI